MRITLDTEKYTVQVHEAVNYEELTHLVDILVDHAKWPADKVQMVQPPPPPALNLCPDRVEQRPWWQQPHTVYCGGTVTTT